MIDTIQMSQEAVLELMDENGGACLACGEEAYGIEPDARRYQCDSCKAREVYGAEELLIMGCIEIV